MADDLSPTAMAMDGMHNGFGGLQGGVNAVTTSLRTLGIINEETAQALTVASSALGIATGVMGIAQLLNARIAVKTAQETAVSAALVAANSWNPVGWARIAVATAAMGVASVAVYAATTRIQADLSTSAGRASATRQVAGAMA